MTGVEEIRIRVTPAATVAASALRYDAECNREVAASMCARARRARARSADLRQESAAVRAQGALALKRARERRRPVA
jgi:hypothetical protein